VKIFEEDINSQHARTFYKFIELSNKMEMAIKKSIKPFGLTHSQLNILYILAKFHPGKLNPADLKDHIIVSNPDITRIIDRLLSKRLVYRETCPENRRKVDISITPKGLKVFEEAHYAAKSSVHDFFEADIDENEALQLRNLLKKIVI
jgi:DNA-binding MarR family transcriptional regulator